jgi:ABC-type transport system substrate-binding protein
MRIIIAVLVGALLGLVTNLVSNFIAPEADKRKKLVYISFVGLIGLSIILALVPDDAVPPKSSGGSFRYYINTLLYHENGDSRPGLAESWEINGTRIKFQLRRGITCRNGSEFNAKYLQSHFYEHKEKWKDLRIKSVDIFDPYTIIVEIYGQNHSELLSALSDSTNPISTIACDYNHRFRGRFQQSSLTRASS